MQDTQPNLDGEPTTEHTPDVSGDTADRHSGFVGPVWKSIRSKGAAIRSLPQLVENSYVYRLFVLMVTVYCLQVVLTVVQSPAVSKSVFVLSPSHPWYIWTWVTHIFAHGNIFHLAVNMVVLISFGRIVEKQMGSKAFLVFFIGTGVVSGLGQLIVGNLLGATLSGLVGASGALAACVGFLTVDSPHLRVLMFFFLPVSLWRASTVLVVLSVTAISIGGVGYLGIAHTVHLIGLALGVGVGAIAEPNMS